MSTVIQHVENWLDQVVIGLNLCPFAATPRKNNQIRFVESSAQNEIQVLDALFKELQRLQRTPASDIETTLLIIPNTLTLFDDYNQFLDIADQLLIDNDWEGVFQIASFHPHYQFAGTRPEDKENLSNRSPYPILHLLREDSLSKALETMSAPDNIYKRNICILNQLSDTQIKELFPYLYGEGI